MPSFEFLAATALVLLAWLWLDSLRARDAAVAAARDACEAEGLMLLDDTVAIAGMRLTRGSDGRIKLQRAYDFEYSDSGDNRIRGSIVLLGRTSTSSLHGSSRPRKRRCSSTAS
ncbi:MAG: DUF3301 domain-containing protein [Rhodospirillaceae bacterium]